MGASLYHRFTRSHRAEGALQWWGEHGEEKEIYSEKKRRKRFPMKENEESKEDREKRSVYLAFSLPWRCSLVSWLFAPSLSAHSLDLQRGCEKREIPKRMRDGPKSTRGKREEEKRGRRT